MKRRSTSERARRGQSNVTVDELLQTIEQRGATLRVVGDRLAVHPKSALTDELRAAIRRHREELVARLKPEPTWRDCTPEEAREELARYKREGWIAIYSEVLGEPIILARDEEAAKVAPAGFVTYTEAEVALLLTATPDELRQVHEAKRFFGGRVVERRQAEEEEKPA